MKRRETIVIPMVKKKKLGAGADRVKEKPPVTTLGTTQFALERAVKRIEALEKQCDGLAKLDKQKDIRINHQDIKINRLRERVERSESE